MLSTADGQIRFRAVEYLKGTGDSTFTVEADTGNRNANWDGQEALLFLTVPTTLRSGVRGDPRRSMGNTDTSTSLFHFTDAYMEIPPTGDLPDGYTIDSNNPAWIPASTTTGGNGGRGESDPTRAYITQSRAPDGSPNPTATLTDIKAEIAYQGAESTRPYAYCMYWRLYDIQYFRDYETYHSVPEPIGSIEREIDAGQPRGTPLYILSPGLIEAYLLDESLQYHQQWITGNDAEMFVSRIEDDDEIGHNGFSTIIETARPLPSGTYTFRRHLVPNVDRACNYANERFSEGILFTITAIAPDGSDDVVHEALFDPVSLPDGLGFSADGGVLDPSEFNTFNLATQITSLVATGDLVTMSLNPYADLTFDTLDFIGLDGAVVASLSDGTGDATTGTITWEATAPWSSGDQLMLRITAPVP